MKNSPKKVRKKTRYSGKGNINEREKIPLTELDQESIVNGLLYCYYYYYYYYFFNDFIKTDKSLDTIQ